MPSSEKYRLSSLPSAQPAGAGILSTSGSKSTKQTSPSTSPKKRKTNPTNIGLKVDTNLAQHSRKRHTVATFEAGNRSMAKDSRRLPTFASTGETPYWDSEEVVGSNGVEIIVAQTPKSSFIQNKQVVHDLLNRQSENVLARIALEQELKQIVNNSRRYNKDQKELRITTFEQQFLEKELATRSIDPNSSPSRQEKESVRAGSEGTPSTPMLRKFASVLAARPQSSGVYVNYSTTDLIPESFIQLDAAILERLQFVAREEEGIVDQISDILDDIYKHVNTTVDDLKLMSTPENEHLINQTIQSLQRIDNRRDVWREQLESSIAKTKSKNDIVFKLLQSERAQHHKLKSHMSMMKKQIKQERSKFKELWNAYQTVQPSMHEDASSVASNSPRSQIRVPLRAKAKRDSLAKRVMTGQAMTQDRRNSIDSSVSVADSSRTNQALFSPNFGVKNNARPFTSQDSNSSLFSNLTERLNKGDEPASPSSTDYHALDLGERLDSVHIQRERKYLWDMVSKKEEEITRLKSILSRKPIKNRMGGKLVKCSIQKHVTEARAFPHVLPHKRTDESHVKKKEAFLVYENEMLTHQANKMLQHLRAIHQSIHNACEDLTMITADTPVQTFVEIFVRWCNEFLTVENPLGMDSSILSKTSTHLKNEFHRVLNPLAVESRIVRPSTPPAPTKPKMVKKMKLKRAATFGQLLISSSIHKAAGMKSIPLENSPAKSGATQDEPGNNEGGEEIRVTSNSNPIAISLNLPLDTEAPGNSVSALANRRGFRVKFDTAKEGQDHMLRGAGTVHSPPAHHHQEIASSPQSNMLFVPKSPRSKHIFHFFQNMMDTFLSLKKNQRFLSQLVRKLILFTNQKHRQLAEPIQVLCEQLKTLQEQLDLERKSRDTFVEAMTLLCADEPQEAGEKKKKQRTVVKKKLSSKAKTFLSENAPMLLEVANLIEKKVTNLPKPIIKKVKLEVPQRTVETDTLTLAPTFTQGTQCNAAAMYEIGLQVTFKGERNLVRLKLQEKDDKKLSEQQALLQQQRELEKSASSLKRRGSNTSEVMGSTQTLKKVSRKVSKTSSKPVVRSQSTELMETVRKNVADSFDMDDDDDTSPVIERVAVSSHVTTHTESETTQETFFVVKKTVEMASIGVQTKKRKKRLKLYLTDRTRDHMDPNKKRRVFRPGKSQVKSRFLDVFRNKKKSEPAEEHGEDEDDDFEQEIDLASPYIDTSFPNPPPLHVSSPVKGFLTSQHRTQLPSLQHQQGSPLGQLAARSRQSSTNEPMRMSSLSNSNPLPSRV